MPLTCPIILTWHDNYWLFHPFLRVEMQQSFFTKRWIPLCMN